MYRNHSFSLTPSLHSVEGDDFRATFEYEGHFLGRLSFPFAFFYNYSLS